jgi:hypothetical protein
MSKNLRIRTTPNGEDNYLKVKLEQDFDFIEILSLKISQEEVYREFCSDYGVAVGRVIVNAGFGVPNAKVSVFIPLSDEDLDNAEIAKLYPYEVVDDTDFEGIRYNLLPKESQTKDICHTPVGTFPSKREVLDNDNVEEVYTKYYKFTTTTNKSGDFMFFGLPVGQHFIHVDADISDIGIVSQKPYDLIREGVSEKKFDSSTKFKGGKQLNKLVQVRTQSPIGVYVRPFWGDGETCDIGITRVDVDLNETITPHAIFTGSLFGDNEKNAISKRCRPRKKTGDMQEVMTSSGRIEMIRKTPSGGTERFDVEGGQVIDDDGVWSYQIPMNLENVITDEFGNLVPSNNPVIGLPTKARVRFRIGMDEIGGLGRVRSRAKFLVPNNPSTFAESDYNFDESASDDSFADLSFNKIYSVKSFIPRFNNSGALNNKSSISMKDVTKTDATKTPFPFNKMDGDLNPLFSFLCFLISVITNILGLVFNSIIITALNVVLFLLNGVLGVICTVVAGITSIVCLLNHLTSEDNRKACRCDNCLAKDNCSDGNCFAACWKGILPYIPYIVFQCPANSGQCYAPYSFGPRFGGKETTEKAYKNCTHIQWPFEGNCKKPDACYLECVTATLAESLDVFEFLFYNDWINGALYYTLFKYKVRSRETNRGTRGSGREKFCEYDCDSFQGYANYTGVDLNNDGTPDNKCRDRNYIVEGCLCDCSASLGIGCDDKTQPFSDGLIKKVDDEFYYAAITHDNSYPLFKTDIISLGSILECDVDGEPHIIDQLYDTTYHLPPIIEEVDENGVVEINGIEPLFTRINCAGINSRQYNCGNIRRYCELAVGDDENRNDDNPATTPDGYLTGKDIESSYIRNVFAWLNEPSLRSRTYDSVNTDFNDNYGGEKRFCNLGDTRNDYKDFRFTTRSPSSGINRITQIKNSFYFYFGLKAGNTAIRKTMNKYFQTCVRVEEPAFRVIGVVTDTSRIDKKDGAITLTIQGGDFPTSEYLFEWVVTPSSYGGLTNIQNLDNLPGGVYTVEVTDPEGEVVKAQFVVAGPPPLNFVIDGQNISKNGLSNGKILLSNINGGIPPYDILLNGSEIVTDQNITSYEIPNLAAGTYTVTVRDSINDTKERTVEILEPELLSFTTEITQPECTGTDNGIFEIFPSGSFPPYDIKVTGPNGYSSQLFLNAGVLEGTYNFTISGNTFNADGTRETATGSVLIKGIHRTPSVTLIQKVDVKCKGDGNALLKVKISPYLGSFVTKVFVNNDRVKTDFFGDDLIEKPFYLNNGINRLENNGELTLIDLDPDEYIIKVQSPGGKCEAQATFDLSEPADALTINYNPTDGYSGIRKIECFLKAGTTEKYTTNAQKYKLTAKPSGGWGGYQYRWYIEPKYENFTMPGVLFPSQPSNHLINNYGWQGAWSTSPYLTITPWDKLTTRGKYYAAFVNPLTASGAPGAYFKIRLYVKDAKGCQLYVTKNVYIRVAQWADTINPDTSCP